MKTETPSTIRSLGKVAAVIGLIVALSVFFDFWRLVIVIASIILIVILHELGHFATAKWSKMKVTEFFVGFGPRIWSIRKGETEYGIKAIPAGGYVKIPGMTNVDEIDPEDEERTYRRKPIRNRILVAVAGSTMHMIIAFILIFVILVSYGTPSGRLKVQIQGLSAPKGLTQSPAGSQGLKVGDDILEVTGKSLWATGAFVTKVEKSAGKPLHLLITRKGKQMPLTLVPAIGHRLGNGTIAVGPGTKSHKTIGVIGMSSASATIFKTVSIGAAIVSSGPDLWKTISEYVSDFPKAIGSVYSSLKSSKVAGETSKSGERAQTIIGGVRTATQALQSGILDFLEVIIALNIAFGLLNILPMLPLDGGYVVIALYERIRTRKGAAYYQADARKMLPVAYGFVAIVGIFVLSLAYLDIAHPVSNIFK